MLTTEQMLTLRQAIAANTDPALMALKEARDTSSIADYYNQKASPAFYAWRLTYTPDQIAEAIETGITQLDALSASKREVLLWWAERPHNPATSQAAINDMCGSQNTLKTAVQNGGKVTVTRGEKIWCTGTGSLALPATFGLTTQPLRIDEFDVRRAFYNDDGSVAV